MLSDPWIAALAALFLWWFSTGAILVIVRLADRRGGRAGLLATLAGLPVLGLGIWGYLVTLDATGVAAAYCGFLAALAIWGWIELAFLTGIVTGPNLRPCPDDLPEWERFLRAWGTVAFHASDAADWRFGWNGRPVASLSGRGASPSLNPPAHR